MQPDINWKADTPINTSTLSKLFNNCKSESEVSTVFNQIANKYHPDYLTGEEEYTKEDCISILTTLNELLQHHKTGKINLVNKPKNKSDFINYSAYRRAFTLANWQDFWQSDLAYGQNLLNLFTKFVALPDMDIQLPIVCAFACQNTALMNLSNILFLYSRKAGSGKSTIAELIAAQQNSLKFDEDDPDGMSQATDTFTSIRNFIAYNKVIRNRTGEIIRDVKTGKPLEKNLFLVLDDMPESKLKDEDYYNLLKAYKRQNAYIRKAERVRDEDGNAVDKTVSFHIFCSKVLTACYQIFGNQEYRELTRRCLFIKCQPLEDIKSLTEDRPTPDYLKDSPFFTGDEFYKPSDINWRNIIDEYHSAWNLEAIERYQNIFRQIKKPREIQSDKWEISKTLVAAGYALKVWETRPEAIKAIKDYWNWFEQQKIDTKSATELVLESAVASWIESANDPIDSAEYFPNGAKNPFYPMDADYINPLWIDHWLKRAEKKSELEKSPTARVRDQAMWNIGYKIRRVGKNNYYCSMD